MKKVINICFLLIVSIMLFSGISFADEWMVSGQIIIVGTAKIDNKNGVPQIVILQEGTTNEWWGYINQTANGSNEAYIVAITAFATGIRCMHTSTQSQENG